jgi:L-alanine-DL-glutamate epimerase-like enolase superfamily enzyme
MGKPTDIRVAATRLYFLPVQARMPLKFGTETLTSVTCARAWVRVVGATGRTAEGWGETPLSVQWVWPSLVPYEQRHTALRQFSREVAAAWLNSGEAGHPLEIGHDFQERVLPRLRDEFNQIANQAGEPMPWLAALLCGAACDLAIHDAYGRLHERPVYETYGRDFLNRDLAAFLEPAADVGASFNGKYPADFLLPQRAEQLLAWHLVGGLDPVQPDEWAGAQPDDGYPVLLADWIQRDGLKCLKVKLRGNDANWDFARLIKVGEIGFANGAEWFSADFNCTVTDSAYVNEVLDRLQRDQPRLFERVLYVEQPFPYDLERHRLDVHSVSQRKPLFLDESAHDWRLVRLGRELGWTGVALKTCKTQTGALLSACWARAHGLHLMVQDLTNPMLAQIPHVLLAAHVGTLKGVETNAMQFYPEASAPEATVHPGIYRRRRGMIDLSTLQGPGFGYRGAEDRRALPLPVVEFGT